MSINRDFVLGYGSGKASKTSQTIIEETDAWLEENISQETGYVLDRTLAMSNAAAPADLVGAQSAKITELKTALNSLEDTIIYDAGTVYKHDTVVTGSSMQSGTPIVSCDISQGEDYTIILEDDGKVFPNSSVTLYYISNGSPTSIGSFPVGSARQFTAETQIDGFSIYKTGLSNGTFTTTVKVIDYNQDSLEWKVDNSMSSKDYLDYTNVNKFNPSTISAQKIINTSSGDLSSNSDYFTSDFIKIGKNETLYFYKINSIEATTARMFAAYNEDKVIIPNLGSNSSVSSVTQSGNMAYIRCSIGYGDSPNMPQNIAVITNNNPKFIQSYGNVPVIKSEYIRKKVNVLSTDSETQIIQKLVSAYRTGNCDVFFERADYTFGTALATVKTDYNLEMNEIPVGHGCRYYFNGATLTATLDLSQLTPEEGDDEFYCNFFGCQRRLSSFEMYDGFLIATDTRYVVHDESNALSGSFKHIYQNMEMQYHTIAREDEYRKCIGGGTGASGVVEIIGCKFTTDYEDACVSYHGNANDVPGAKFDINVRNSWFGNFMRAGTLSANQTGHLFYTGNSATEAPRTATGWTVTEYLNEIRT